ncbi:hypothetical protein GWI33_020951 [Rhynchophorus ferrugineus]|uniref:Uncharacterized protein n=1 Tax=Rhynchophorus ferrugineus TaxID=354439 RepID=A0A834M5A7_RHYFE|nr:hypothetical protein GWI33_020951 [Rhynchophorus ferrugineus]
MDKISAAGNWSIQKCTSPIFCLASQSPETIFSLTDADFLRSERKYLQCRSRNPAFETGSLTSVDITTADFNIKQAIIEWLSELLNQQVVSM